jgi:hypothetical protein
MSIHSNPWCLLAAAVLLGPFGTALAQSASLQQCANGTASAPRACAGSGWVTGNINKKAGHYAEGQAVPFRLILSGYIPGSTGHTVTLEWDTTDGGRHAYDYLATFDRTETLAMGNNPCSGVAGCSLGTFTTFPIPLDPQVAGAGVTQVPGVFALFGGTITSVSAYTLIGSYSGRSTTLITLVFTANQTNSVLAWSGHLASRIDWGLADGTAADVNGSFQTRLFQSSGRSQGNQARSISGVAPPGTF